MTLRTLCFDTTAALRDRRFRRKLTKYEGMDFVFLLGFAGAECFDPAFIPARKMEDLALDMGWTGKAGEAQKEKRLAKWSAPGIELIELQEDGGIQINYLLDQELEEEEEQAFSPSPSELSPSRTNGNGLNSTLNSNLDSNLNGSGPEKRNGTDRRQSNRRYKQNPTAERQRKSYWERKRKETGISSGDFAPAGDIENLTESLQEETQNLTPFVSKPHAAGDENGANSAENLTLPREVLREVSPVRVRDVKDVVGDLNNYSNSDYVSDVEREKNLTQNLTAENLTDSGQNLTASAGKPGSGTIKLNARGRPAAPAPRPPLSPGGIPAQRQFDVRQVLKATGDDPVKWEAQWKALWNHCQSRDQLFCWDVGVVYFAWRLKVSPPASIKKNAPWLRGVVLNQLEEAGAPYIPKSGGQNAPGPVDPVDAEEEARIREEIRSLKAEWAAEEEAQRGVITPLEELYPEDGEDGDTHSEREDDDGY